MTEKKAESLSTRIWRRLALFFIAVFGVLLVLLSAASFLLSTQTGSEWALTQVVQRLNAADVPVVIEDVRGTIFRGLSFGRVQLDDDSGSYVIEGLRTSWNPYSLLTGQLVLSDLWISSLRVEIPGNDTNEMEGVADSKLDIAIISNPAPMGIVISSLRIEKLEVVRQEEATTVRSISLGARLEPDSLNVSDLQLISGGFELGGDIALGFADSRAVTASLDWRTNATLNNRSEVIAGQLDLSGDLSAVELTHVLESPQRIRSSGSVVTGLFAGDLEFDLQHTTENLVLPFDLDMDYELSVVSLGTSGNLEEVSLSLQSDLLYEEYPLIVVSGEAVYAGSTLNLQSYSLTSFENMISGAARIDWSNVIVIDGDYTLQLPNINSLVEMPSSVSLAGLAGTGNFEVALPEAGAEGVLTITGLSGRIADFPMQGRGTIAFNQGAIQVNDLQLRTENNQLNLDGSYSDNLDLDWSISAASLEEFLVGSSGTLEGRGSLTGDPTSPDIAGVLSGSAIAYQQLSTDQFDFEFQRINGQIQSQLSINRVSYTDGDRIESLAPLVLDVSGTEGSHRIVLDAESRFGDLTAALTGGFSDFRNMAWEGRLESAAMDTSLGSWSTRAATGIAIASTGVDVAETCWSQLQSVLCFAFSQNFDDGITATGSLQNYPLSVFNSGQALNAGAGVNLDQEQLLLLPQLPNGAALTGQVDGQFSLGLPLTEDLIIDFELAARDALLTIIPELLSAGDEVDEEMETQEYDLQVLELAGGAQSGAWQLIAEAEILRENFDDSEIDVRGAVTANVNIAANDALSGTIEAGLEDLRWLQALVPELSDVGGSLNGRANLAGDLSAPQATGTIDLNGAHVSIDSLGIRLSDIVANISSDGPDSVRITGRAQSDEGSIDFNGEIMDPFAEATTFSAQVSGDDFQLANVPNLELNVSPNVVITIDGTGIEVIGSLDVPTLKLTLEQLPESAVDVSRDVVIVNYPDDRPELARSIAAAESTVFDRPVTGAVDITLGDDVSFSGFGMNTTLAGNLNIQQTAGGSNLTYGELTIVEGSYEMYRQSLDISQGKFLFFGAYDNPGIDLRATREVDDYTVGVLMNGTLKNINSQLFSTPSLPDNDIIAVLVTGRPFSEAGAADSAAMLSAIAKLGVGRSEGLTNQVRSKLGLDVLAVDATDDINNSVLTIGKYLTPDIFVRYGIGLFDSQSKVAVDYTITERIKLQAESGDYQSVDIIYSVER